MIDRVVLVYVHAHVNPILTGVNMTDDFSASPLTQNIGDSPGGGPFSPSQIRTASAARVCSAGLFCRDSVQGEMAGDAGWCHCMLHSDSTSGCGAAPPWLQDHTGRAGEMYFKVQDAAWGNAMMQLRDSVSCTCARPPSHSCAGHAEPVRLRAARSCAGLEPAPSASGRRLVATPLPVQSLLAPRGRIASCISRTRGLMHGDQGPTP